MTSETLLIFCIIATTCSTMCATPTKCYHKVLAKDGKTIEDKGFVECKAGQDACYYYAVSYKHKLDMYSQGCMAKAIVPYANKKSTKKTLVINDGPTKGCDITQGKTAIKITCICEDDLCNGDDKEQYHQFIKLYKEQNGVEFNQA